MSESETDHKRRLRNVIGGWSESYEPGQGSGVGYPDLQFDLGQPHGLIPVEVKAGRLMKCGPYRILRVKTSIRASQIAWHDNFLSPSRGNVSFIFVCFGEGEEFEAWSLPLPFRCITMEWRQGWNTLECKQIISKGKMVKDLLSLVAEAKEDLSRRDYKGALVK